MAEELSGIHGRGAERLVIRMAMESERALGVWLVKAVKKEFLHASKERVPLFFSIRISFLKRFSEGLIWALEPDSRPDTE